MDIGRRDFGKGCVATSILLLAGIDSAAKREAAIKAPVSAIQSSIEKSIKASFGGGFKLRSHARSGGLTYAEIEHFGNKYAIASTDLLDWEIVRSSPGDLSFASSSVSGSSISAV